MQSTYLDIHPDFKLNGISYNVDELRQLAYSFIKEGKTHEIEIGKFLSQWLDAEPTLKVKTSGSTGSPKIIELLKQYMVNSALATADFFDLNANTTALLCLPATYIAGKMMLVRAMVLGWELDYVNPTSNPIVGISKDYEFSAMVPLQLENSLEHLEKFKTIIVGGSPVSSSLKTKIQSKSATIFETYGMTETVTHVAARNVKLSAVDVQNDDHVDKIQNYFKALPNVSFSKDDRDCLIISAPKISDNLVVTNDIVKLVSKTEFEWLGRYDNVINSGGVKLFPEQIEAKLKAYITNRFFVAGLPDETLGKRLVLIVEGNIDVDMVLNIIRESDNFDKYELPKKVYTIPQFIETNSGKIQRKENVQNIL